MNKKIIAIFVVIFMIGCLSSYRFGIHLSHKAFGDDLLEVQAMLSFNHLQSYEEISVCLEKGLSIEAKGKTNHAVISERELLAGFLSSIKSTRLNEYISIRTNESLESLKGYKYERGSRWTVPSCK